MPSEKILAQKKETVSALSEQLKNACAGVLVDYKGINVEDDTKLRRKLREAGVSYAVIKNAILRFAVDEAGLSEMKDVLAGTTALAISADDPVAAARVLCEFADDHKNFTVKLGFVDGKVIPVSEIETLAKLPPREVLIAKALGGLNAPITGLVYVLDANITGLARVLGAIAEQKSA